MKGRYWVGLMGAVAILAVTACASFFLPVVGGFLALIAVVIGGALVGYVVTRVDEEVKANPAAATNAGAVAGLITGIGAGGGYILGAVIWGALVSFSLDAFGPDFERMLRQSEAMTGAQLNMTTDAFVSFASLTLTGIAMCFGLLGIGLSAGTAALVARLSAPGTPTHYGPGAPVDPLPPYGDEPTPSPAGGRNDPSGLGETERRE